MSKKSCFCFYLFIIFIYSSCTKNKNIVTQDNTHTLRAYYDLHDNKEFSFAVLHLKESKNALDTVTQK